MKVHSVLAVLVAGLALSSQALPEQSPNLSANIVRESDGTLLVSAGGPRPLWQAVDALRKRYGWTVDYEESKELSQAFAPNKEHTPILRGGALELHINEPVDGSPVEERRVLKQLVDQYNQVSQVRYRVISTTPTRFDLAPADDSVLDRPVVVDSEQRSLRGEIDAILSSIQAAAGACAEQGGLISNAMEQGQISLHHAGAVPARKLITEVLDQAPNRRVWLLTYEPSNGCYAMGIQNTEQWIRSPNGGVQVKGFANRQSQSPTPPAPLSHTHAPQ